MEMILKWINTAFWASAGAIAKIAILCLLVACATMNHISGTIAAAAIMLCFEMGSKK